MRNHLHPTQSVSRIQPEHYDGHPPYGDAESQQDWKTVEHKDGHWWGHWMRDPWQSCRICGRDRRADDKNKPCRGPAEISLR